MSDAYDNAINAHLVHAADVRPGDVIAGGHRPHRWFITGDACRTVSAVEPLPAGPVRITYTTARGQEFTREFEQSIMFYRLPAAPAVPDAAALEDLPEPLPKEEYDYMSRDADTNGRLTAEALTRNNLRSAHSFAKGWKAIDDKLEADKRLRKLIDARDAAAIEAAGGEEHDKLWPWKTYEK